MKKVIKYLKKIWFVYIKKEKIYTVLVRGRIKEKNKKFLSLYGKKYIKNKKDIESFFTEKNKKDAVLEIGFGDGKHLTEKAIKENKREFWGVELYSLGVILAAKKLFQKDIKNVSLLEMDARMLIEKSPDDFWCEIDVLFPDPWRKKKHFKRRILQQDFIEAIIKKTTSEGKVILATDWETYSAEIKISLDTLQDKTEGKLFSFIETIHKEALESSENLILKTSFAERAFREGRRVAIFEIQKN